MALYRATTALMTSNVIGIRNVRKALRHSRRHGQRDSQRSKDTKEAVLPVVRLLILHRAGGDIDNWLAELDGIAEAFLVAWLWQGAGMG